MVKVKEMAGNISSIHDWRRRLINSTAGQGITVLMLLAAVCVFINAFIPTAVIASNEIPSGTVAPAPVKPQLTATVIIAPQIGFCRNFNFHVSVINYGNAPAKDVHLYFRQFPGGFFTLMNIDQTSTPIAKYAEDIALGNINANEQREINFVVSVPLQTKLNADWSRRFYFNFTSSFNHTPEEILGSIMFLANKEKIIVQKSGFTQQ